MLSWLNLLHRRINMIQHFSCDVTSSNVTYVFHQHDAEKIVPWLTFWQPLAEWLALWPSVQQFAGLGVDVVFQNLDFNRTSSKLKNSFAATSTSGQNRCSQYRNSYTSLLNKHNNRNQVHWNKIRNTGTGFLNTVTEESRSIRTLGRLRSSLVHRNA